MENLVAQIITNPAVRLFGGTGQLSGPGAAAASFALLAATLWRTAVTLGGIALLVMLIYGGLEWILAGGDKGKIESAQQRMTQAVIGMLVLIGTVAISVFIGSIFGLNLLRPEFANNIQGIPQNQGPALPPSGGSQNLPQNPPQNIPGLFNNFLQNPNSPIP